MIACICGGILEGLFMLSALGLATLSIPATNWYNRRQRRKCKCKKH